MSGTATLEGAGCEEDGGKGDEAVAQTGKVKHSDSEIRTEGYVNRFDTEETTTSNEQLYGPRITDRTLVSDSIEHISASINRTVDTCQSADDGPLDLTLPGRQRDTSDCAPSTTSTVSTVTSATSTSSTTAVISDNADVSRMSVNFPAPTAQTYGHRRTRRSTVSDSKQQPAAFPSNQQESPIDERLKNMCKSTKDLIDLEYSIDFVSTYAERSALKWLMSFGSIFILGKCGSGKSRLGLRLLMEMERVENRIPVVITSPDQWHLISKTKDKQTYEQKKSTKKSCNQKFIVMIDDIFGTTNLVQSQVDEWTRMFTIMWPSVESGDVFIVMTSRPEIHSNCKHRLKKYSIVKDEHSFMIDQGKYALREGEKCRMLKAICGVKSNFTIDEVKQIAKMNSALGFPQCCKFFAASRQAQRKGIQFFLKPNEFILEEVNKIQECDGLGYLVLLLVLLKKGHLETKELDPLNCTVEFRQLKNQLQDVCMNLSTRTSLSDIRHKADSLCGGFLTHRKDAYEFQHQSIFESLFICVSRQYPGICLLECPVSMIMEFVRTQKSATEIAEVSILLQKENYDIFAERMTQLILSEDFYVFIGYNSTCKISHIVNDRSKMKCNSNISEHPSLNDEEFVDHLIEQWSVAKKLANMLHNTYSPCVFASRMSIRPPHSLFQVDDLLSYMIYKNNFVFAKLFISKCCAILDSDSWVSFGQKSLPCAIYKGNNDLIKMILATGATPDEICFRALCASHDVEEDLTDFILNSLLRTGDNLRETIKSDWNTFPNLKELFCLAMHEGNINVVKWLANWLKHNKESKVIFGQCLTSLFKSVATRKNQTETGVFHRHLYYYTLARSSFNKSFNMSSVAAITQFLLDIGCEINPNYLLLLAAAHPDASALKQILKLNVDIRKPHALGSELPTPLQQATAYGGKSCLEEIFRWMQSNQGEQVMKPEESALLIEDESQPQESARASIPSEDTSVKYADIVRYFDTKQTFVKSLLHLAAQFGNVESMGVLLKIGFPVDIQNRNGNTPLHDAVQYDHHLCVKLLLDNKASVNMPNSMLKTPLQLIGSIRPANMDTVKELIYKGSDPNQLDNDGKTLLYCAAAENEFDTVALLCRKGANVDCVIYPASYKCNAFSRSTITFGSFQSAANPESAVHVACRNADFYTMKFLCERTNKLSLTNNRGQTLLHIAAGSHIDSVEKLQYLLDEKHAPIDAEDNAGRTALFAAAWSNDIEGFHFLQERGLDINHRDKHGRSMLFHLLQTRKNAFKKYHSGGHFLKIMRKILENGINVSLNDKHGETVLHAAARLRDQESIQLLIEFGADPCVQDKRGRTPLHIATRMKYSDMLRLLLDKGACTNVQDKTDQHLAARTGDAKCAELDLKNHATSCIYDQTSEMPLHLAGKSRIINMFMTQGSREAFSSDEHVDDDEWIRQCLHSPANSGSVDKHQLPFIKEDIPCIVDQLGRTPLHFVAKNNYCLSTPDNLVTLLNKYGVCVHDNLERMPLHLAAGRGNLPCAELLLDNGANPCSADCYGRTPLLQAVGCGSDFLVHKLLDLEASASVQDNNGRTPLHLASGCRNSKLIKLLLASGANPHVQDLRGRSPLHLAVQNCDMEIINILTQHSLDLVTPDIQGKSILHYAAGRQRTKSRPYDLNCIEYLIYAGYDPCQPDRRGLTPLHIAAMMGSHYKFRLLLEHGAHPCVQDKQGRTPLHFTSTRRQVESAEFLLDNGASPCVRDNKGRTPLHFAAGSGNSEVIQYLLQKGANACTQDNKGRTILHLAVGSNNVDAVKMLLENQTILNMTDQLRRTALHYAAATKQVNIVRMLIEAGLDPCAKDHHERTAIHIAAKNGTCNTLCLLIEKGGQPFSQDKEKKTALHYAALSGSLSCVKQILKEGASPNTQDQDGLTALHIAASTWNTNNVELLLEKGADHNIEDGQGRTALHHATETNTVKILLRKGADPCAKDKDGKTPLHFAAKCINSDPAKLLLEHGTDLSEMNIKERTALHFAAESGSSSNVELLVAKGADTKKRDKKGTTPVHLAADRVNVDCVRILLDSGACPNAQDNSGYTPLHLVARQRKHDRKIRVYRSKMRRPKHLPNAKCAIQKLLIVKGANLSLKDTMGKTPLHLAAENNNSDSVKLLLENRADSSLEDINGKTALDLAREKDHSSIVDLLTMVSL